MEYNNLGFISLRYIINLSEPLSEFCHTIARGARELGWRQNASTFRQVDVWYDDCQAFFSRKCILFWMRKNICKFPLSVVALFSQAFHVISMLIRKIDKRYLELDEITHNSSLKKDWLKRWKIEQIMCFGFTFHLSSSSIVFFRSRWARAHENEERISIKVRENPMMMMMTILFRSVARSSCFLDWKGWRTYNSHIIVQSTHFAKNIISKVRFNINIGLVMGCQEKHKYFILLRKEDMKKLYIISTR